MKALLQKLCSNFSGRTVVLFIAAFFAFNLSVSSTNVSGGIYSNTTWTLAGSPYIITDTLVVFAGVTLTIQPGVVVKFDNIAYFDIRGNLYANGTAVDSIIFTSNSASPYAGIYDGVHFNGLDTASFKYCSFYYANGAVYAQAIYPGIISHCRFTSNITGVSTDNATSVDTCVFRYDTVGIMQPYYMPISGCVFNYNGVGIDMPDQAPISNCIITKNNYGIRNTSNNTIKYCIIDSNRAVGLDGGGHDSIFNCDISYNGTGTTVVESILFLNTISNNTNDGLITYYNSIMCNSICNNTPYNVVMQDNVNEVIKGNYWCLPDSAHIESTIYDGRTNISYGLLFFTPFDTVACINYCNMTVSATATNTVVCSNSSTTLSANVSDGYSYTVTWKPGNYTGMNYTVTPTANTTYTLVVTDTHGCIDSITITIDTMYCAPGCTLTTQAYANNPFMASCSSDTLRIHIHDASSGIKSVVWQPGNYSGAPYVVSPAATTTYTVTVTDSLGCTFTSSASIYVSGSLAPPSICYVTADTASNHNIVVWSKVGIDTLSIDSMLIYREVTYNNYVRIGAVSIHAYTEFMDLTSHPTSQSYFYEIAEKDTCNSSSLSTNAETILLQSSRGFGNQVNLGWNLYVGNTVDYYRIMRDDSGTGNWHVIDSVPGNVGAYIDVNAPSSSHLRYILNTAWSLSCVPYLIMDHKKNTVNNSNSRFRFNTTDESYSNITNIVPNGINQILISSDVDVYPNPVSNELTITMHQAIDGTVTITDVLGQDVYSGILSSGNGSTQKLNVSNLSQGVYILKIASSGQTLTKRLIKI